MSRLQSNTAKLALISFFSALYFYAPVLTLYYQQRGLNFTQINSLWGIITATIFLAEVPTGIIADKIGRKSSIILSLALQTLGEVMYIFASNYFVFAITSIIAGIGFAFASGSVEALTYDSLKEEGKEDQMPQAAGAQAAAGQAAAMIAPLVGGLIVSSSNLNISKFIVAIGLTALAVSVALAISFFLKEPHLKTPFNKEWDSHGRVK